MITINLREGVREDGTVEGCVIETHYRPLKYVVPMLGYLRLVADDNATDIETRLPTEMLVELGWTPPVWRDPDTGRTTPRPQPISAEQARAALSAPHKDHP